MDLNTQHSSDSRRLVLLTGASGYVGGRLVNLLAKRSDLRIRCLARTPDNVHVDEGLEAEICRGDLLEPDSLQISFAGVHTAYFLVHALGSSTDFEQREESGARNFVEAARAAQVKRIIYLGGLGEDVNLSPHLRSRQKVGEILRASGIPTIEFRASIIIGSGSLSFELVRSLTEKLPVMITPRWVNSLAQPIAICNVLEYLIAALDHPLVESKVYEIGGPDRVPYSQLMKEYARQRSLSRLMLPVPVLTPQLSSLWLGLVTPVYARVGRKLIDSLIHDTIVTNQDATTAFSVKPVGYSEAIAQAIAREDKEVAETCWHTAMSSAGNPRSWGGIRFGSRLVDARSFRVSVDASTIFEPVRTIGGKQGWYFGNLLWRIRGWIDLLVGGVGMRRGRRHPRCVRVGDSIDFWRVEEFEDNRLLRLRAEMKLPGRAWLQFEVVPEGNSAVLTQTAIFDPVGLSGLLYWYLLYPVHSIIFQNMLEAIVNTANKSIRPANDNSIVTKTAGG